MHAVSELRVLKPQVENDERHHVRTQDGACTEASSQPVVVDHPGAVDQPPTSAAPDADDARPISKAKIAVGVAAILVIAGLYWSLSQAGALPAIADQQALRAQIESLGF